MNLPDNDILIIDDTAANLKLLANILSDAGYEVRTASNASLAFRSIQAKLPALILLDIKMPGVDGFEVCLQLKQDEKTKSIPIIFCSALGDGQSVTKGFEFGAVDYISKPYHGQEVIARVNTHITLNKMQIELEYKNRALTKEISERVQTEEALRKNQIILTAAEKISNQGSWEWDIENDEWTFSDNWLSIHGCAFSKISREELMSLAHPGDAERIENEFNDAIQRIKPYDISHRIIRLDNKEIRHIKALGEVVQDKSGKPIKMYGTAQDITELKKIEIELEKSEENFRKLFNSSRDGYVINKGSGELLKPNPAYAEMLGYNLDEILNVSWRDITPKKWLEWELENHGKTLLERGYTDLYEKEYIHKDGTTFPVEVQAFLLSKAEKLEDVVIGAFVRDISDKKKAEMEAEKLQQHVQQATKMQAVGTLAGGIAHEFNNLLGVIMGCADMARDEVPEDSFAKTQLDKVMKASYRAKDLVKQILIFSRQAQQKKIPVNLCPLVKESLKLIYSSIPSSVAIKANFDSSCSTALADPTEIQQIIMNLCSNAVWALKEKGTITINLHEVKLDTRRAIDLGIAEGKYIKLFFSDTGQGMDDETQTRIFDPFYTQKEVGEGTGMGLSIVYGIMESYGGTITVESKVGKGTTFHLYFPVTEEQEVEKTELTEEISTGTQRILFVDDEEMYAEMGSEMISRLGYDVDLKINSAEALESFKSAPDTYDLVITDQIMPDLSGDELVKEIRSIRPEIPIILCTGYSTQMDEKKATSLGINEFAFKPIVKKDIAKLIRKVLDG